MESSCLAVALLVFTACYSAGASSMGFKSELEVLAHEELKMMVDSFFNEKIDEEQTYGDQRMVGFSYDNCADPSKEAVVISSMDIKPDPIRIPGSVNMTFDSVIKTKFGAPLSAKLTVHKKILGVWIEIPCVDNVGSCTYKDVCTTLAKKVKTCPPALVKQGLNCRCPVSPAKVSLKDYPVKINYKVPSVADGDVKVKIELVSGNQYVTCLEMSITLN